MTNIAPALPAAPKPLLPELETQAKVAVTTKRKDNQRLRVNRKTSILVVGLLTAAAVLSAGYCFFQKPLSPEQVVMQFVTATASRDPYEIVQCLSGGSIELLGGKERAREAFAGTPAFGVTPTLLQRAIAGRVTYDSKDTAAVELISAGQQARAISAGGNPLEIVTILENGEWKVDAIQTAVRMQCGLPAHEGPRCGFQPSPGGSIE